MPFSKQLHAESHTGTHPPDHGGSTVPDNKGGHKKTDEHKKTPSPSPSSPPKHVDEHHHDDWEVVTHPHPSHDNTKKDVPVSNIS